MYEYYVIEEILKDLGVTYISCCDKKIRINKAYAVHELQENGISWIKHLDCDIINELNKLKEYIIFASLQEYKKEIRNVIFVDNLKYTFFEVIKRLFIKENIDNKTPKIEYSSTILTLNYGDNLYVGHNCFIDSEVEIGNNVTIMNNVVIQGKVIIGNDCFIESGTVIGACGFGYYKDKDNNPQKVPHLGRVIIGNHVYIGAGNCISRGSLNDTVISDYVKTDNLCHIAHSDFIGERVMIAACAELSGSVKIGNDTWIAPGTTVINGVDIGENVYIGIGTNILKNVPDNALIYGNPGRIKEK